jgi:hypothetical protein
MEERVLLLLQEGIEPQVASISVKTFVILADQSPNQTARR